MLRLFISTMAISLQVCAAAGAQPIPRWVVGAATGISTLSADARSQITPTDVDVSLYKPENGPALNLFVAVHLQDYVTVQANYVWNRNDVTLTSVGVTGAGAAVSEQPRLASQHAVVGDLLVYFRERRSAVRPYLSVGLGIVRLQTTDAGQGHVGAVSPPPTPAAAIQPLLRVAVGLDVALAHGWGARYSFSESVSANPISAQLSPPGQRSLANFQNLFGLVHAF